MFSAGKISPPPPAGGGEKSFWAACGGGIGKHAVPFEIKLSFLSIQQSFIFIFYSVHYLC
jgi:hypothetical protein